MGALEAIDAFKKNMVMNRAGGLVHSIDDRTFLDRVLILGTEKNTYYASGTEMTLEALQRLAVIAQNDSKAFVDRVVEVSRSGRAPSNSPALLAMALALSCAPPDGRSYAASRLPLVARTGTHLMEFLSYAVALRGWGRVLRNAVAAWFNERSPWELAYQAIKYQNRGGWSLKRALCNSHATTSDPVRNDMFFWIANGWKGVGPEPPPNEALHQIWAFETLKRLPASDVNSAVHLIAEYRLPREAVPTRFLSHAKVWEALLWHMPITALLRNLVTLSRKGLLTEGAEATSEVIRQITNRDRLRRGRVHPIAIAVALQAYSDGGSKWVPLQSIVDALEHAFDLSFSTIEPTNKTILVAIDVSASMSSACVPGTGMQAAHVAALMAMTFARVEPQTHIIGFNRAMRPLDVSATTSRRDVLKRVANLIGGGTDISVPIVWAAENKIPLDAFVLLTDNETWANDMPVAQCLDVRYRAKVNPNAALVAGATTATQYSVTDPTDPRSLSIAGFDLHVPNLVATFIRGFDTLPIEEENEAE